MNTVTINEGNVESEVLEYNGIVVVLLTANEFPEDQKAKLKSEVEKTYGDKYKIAIGSIEENGFLYSNILVPPIYPPLPGITVVKNGEPLRGIFLNPANTTQAFDYINAQIANS